MHAKGAPMKGGHDQEVINGYLVAHFATRCRTIASRKKMFFMNLNSHDVICIINRKRENILITEISRHKFQDYDSFIHK